MLDIDYYCRVVRESPPKFAQEWADKFNIDKSYVHFLGRQYGLIYKYIAPGKKPSPQTIQITQFVQENPGSWTIKELSNKFGLHYSTIQKIVKKYDLKVKRGSMVRVKKMAKENVIKKALEERGGKYKRITPTGISYIGDWNRLDIQLDGGRV